MMKKGPMWCFRIVFISASDQQAPVRITLNNPLGTELSILPEESQVAARAII